MISIEIIREFLFEIIFVAIMDGDEEGEGAYRPVDFDILSLFALSFII